MTILAIQKKRISQPVSRTDVGYRVSRSWVLLGQPRVLKGQRPEENQAVYAVSCQYPRLFSGQLTIENVLITLKSKLLAGQGSLGLLLGLLLSPASEPELLLGDISSASLDLGKVRRALVTPPELSADTPVIDVLHPAVVTSLGSLGPDLDLAILDDLQGWLSKLLHPHPPLRLHYRLNDILGLLTQGHLHGVILLVNEETLLLESVLDGVTDIEALLSLISAGILVHETVVSKDVDELELVPLSKCEIVGVVSRGKLDSTSSKLHVDVIIGNNRQLAALDEGVYSSLAYEVRIPLVLGVDSDTGITQHGLNTSSGNLDGLVRALDLVLEVNNNTKLNLLLVTRDLKECSTSQFLVNNLQVGESSVQLGAPVDKSVCAVDDALLVELVNLRHDVGRKVLHSLICYRPPRQGRRGRLRATNPLDLGGRHVVRVDGPHVDDGRVRRGNAHGPVVGFLRVIELDGDALEELVVELQSRFALGGDIGVECRWVLYSQPSISEQMYHDPNNLNIHYMAPMHPWLCHPAASSSTHLGIVQLKDVSTGDLGSATRRPFGALARCETCSSRQQGCQPGGCFHHGTRVASCLLTSTRVDMFLNWKKLQLHNANKRKTLCVRNPGTSTTKSRRIALDTLAPFYTNHYPHQQCYPRGLLREKSRLLTSRH